jgi:serine/threonine-protein kinase RsbW
VSSKKTIKLEIPTSPQYVSVARKAVEAIAFGMGLPDETADDLKLAVGEACTNAVKYSVPNGHSVQVLYHVTPDKLEVEVRNTGTEFRPETRRKKPCIGCLPVGGLGLHVIEEVMDEVSITSENGETILKMTKRFKR